MDLLYIFLISIVLLILLFTVLFADSKSSNSIHRKGDKLTIWYPLKEEVIDLNTDLTSWNVQSIRPLWWGRLYAVNLELKSGKWKRVYTRSLTGRIRQLIEYLEENAKDKQAQPLE